jgi:hypothetical protein
MKLAKINFSDGFSFIVVMGMDREADKISRQYGASLYVDNCGHELRFRYVRTSNDKDHLVHEIARMSEVEFTEHEIVADEIPFLIKPHAFVGGEAVEDDE